MKDRIKHTGAFSLIDGLVRNGTKYIFGYPGGAILPIYDELYSWEQKNLLKHILVRHEQGAAHAADGYARVTGKAGVCFATSGPGATNLVTGIATAQMDSIPLVIITGQVGSSFLGTDAFQETDIFGITLPIVKHSYLVSDVSTISRIISEAFYIAQNGRPGPVLIDIPKNLGGQEFFTSGSRLNEKSIVRFKVPRYLYRSPRYQLDLILDRIAEANCPLLYIGGGAVSSNAFKEIAMLSRYFQIPVTTTLMGKGAFDENNSLALGMLGMHGTAYANFSVSQCDLLVAIGARFDDRVTGKLSEFAPESQTIHIDIDPAEIGKNKKPTLFLIGDIKKILAELIKIIKRRGNNVMLEHTLKWRTQILEWKQTHPLVIPSLGDNSQDLFSPQSILSILNTVAPTALITTDVGQHQMWSAQFLKCQPRKWSSSAGLGTMGYGLPAAIGNQMAFPNKLVISITGDASIQMNIQELGTISQYQLPIKVLLLNNRWQGMVRQWQESFYGKRYSHSSMQAGMPDFVQLANSYGIRGKMIAPKDKIDIKQELLDEILTPGPCFIDCQIIKEENCYPMVKPGKSTSEMFGVENPPNLKVKFS
ncbi:MAG: biosynthetic-type acetolactate synthase large subunit [Pseudomonadota bacterium]